MATACQSVNLPPGPRDPMEVTTPTTPRAPIDLALRTPAPMMSALSAPDRPRDDMDATTPTRNSFAAANGKRALPASPFHATFPDSSAPVKPEDEPSGSASATDSADVDMTMSADEGEDASDTESNDDQGTDRPSKKKKKKGQRFFCTDFPPCKLSFTRSEHLARHIRKHTGERPFQCHCSRRFSRLDNLRQHAQTVHINEDIPCDSLAATGSRFQRQMRNERMRTPGRARASSSGQMSSHARGHGRNLSTSSIASTASNMSSLSAFPSMPRDPAASHRPHSLSLAEQMQQPLQPSPRSSLRLDTFGNSPQPNMGSYIRSPADNSNPSSSGYLGTPQSPFSATTGSPAVLSRASWGPAERVAPSRRLSVPSSGNNGLAGAPAGSSPAFAPFGSRYGAVHPPPLQNPISASINSSHSSLMANPSHNSPGGAPPGPSIFTFGLQATATKEEREAAEAERRRRTWHPSTLNPVPPPRPVVNNLAFGGPPPEMLKSGFAGVALGSSPEHPSFQPRGPGTGTQRLPGFETFDQISQQRPLTPQRPASGISISSSTTGGGPETPPQHRPLLFSSTSDRSIPPPEGRRRSGHASWDMSLHQNLTKLDLTNGTPPKESSGTSSVRWSQGELVAPLQQPQQYPPSSIFAQAPPHPKSRPHSLGPMFGQSSTLAQVDEQPHPEEQQSSYPHSANNGFGRPGNTPPLDANGRPSDSATPSNRSKRPGWYNASMGMRSPTPNQPPINAASSLHSSNRLSAGSYGSNASLAQPSPPKAGFAQPLGQGHAMHATNGHGLPPFNPGVSSSAHSSMGGQPLSLSAMNQPSTVGGQPGGQPLDSMGAGAWHHSQRSIHHRPSPEDSSSSEGVATPASSSVAMDYQPGIMHANGYVEPQPTATAPAPKPTVTNFSHPFRAIRPAATPATNAGESSAQPPMQSPLAPQGASPVKATFAFGTAPSGPPGPSAAPQSGLRGLDALVAAAESKDRPY